MFSGEFSHRGPAVRRAQRLSFTQRLLQASVLFLIVFISKETSAQLTVLPDPACAVQCCTFAQPCNCMAGVTVSGGTPPYSYMVFDGSGVVGNTACVSGLCPGTYFFRVTDAIGVNVIVPVNVQPRCCTLICSDTSICFDLPDSLVTLPPPSYTSAGGSSGGSGGPGGDCVADSTWNNAPGAYPVGTTVVTWYVLSNGQIDSCSQNVIRNPPSAYNISFTTSPPIISGVINICNGQSITFNDNSTGISGLLWNFGNGYYSSNPVHTEPAWHYPPGTYYDTLTVFDDCGTPHDTAFMVTVDSASGPDIECISVVCPGDTVTYHTNANCTGYSWTVTGGTFLTPPSPTSDSVTIIWGPGPQGTISLSVTGCTPPLNCPFATIKTVTIVPSTLPIAGDTIICAGAVTTHCVECIPGNNHSWELMPANAGTVSGQNTCCVTIQWSPTFFGIATLTVNYQNVLTGDGCNLPETCGDDHDCGGTGTITIDVRPIFGISGPQKVCPGTMSLPFSGMNLTNNTVVSPVSWKVITPFPNTLTFANTAAFNSYLWNDGTGVYQVTAYPAPGIYCNDSAIVTVEVVNMLAPNAITGPDTVCAGQGVIYSVAPNMTGVTYNWTVSGGIITGPPNGSSVTIQWNPGGGTISVTQVLSASPFCASAPSPVFTVATWPNFTLPVITPSNPVACVKSTITYTIPPALISNGTYTWSVSPATAGNIVTANGTNTITINWIDASITPVYVKLKISRCYEDSVMYLVNLLPLPPVPDIIAPASVCLGTTVNFATTSAGPLWNWDFGDATTANTQNAPHTYAAAGDYNVLLTVTNANGCSDTAYTKIHIDGVPQQPVLTGPLSVCVGSTATYSFPQSLFPGASYIWSVGPQGSILSGQGSQSINVKWNSVTAGAAVSVTILSTCPATPALPLTVAVNPLPVASIGIPSPLCIGSPLVFIGSGGTTYNWNFPGASNVDLTNPASPAVTYGLPGNYTASLAVIDANGCTANTTVSFTVNPLPFVQITSTPVCNFPASVTLATINAGGNTYLWTPTGSTTASITQTLSGPATYSVAVTNASGCTATDTETINGGSCPPVPGTCPVTDTIDFTSTPPVCLSTTFTESGTAVHTGWIFGDGGTAGAVSPVSHTYPFPGIYNVIVTGTGYGIDGGGMPCSVLVVKQKLVTIPFDADFEVDYRCNGSNVMEAVITNNSLFLNNATDYTWDWYLDNNAVPFSTTAFPPNQVFSAGPHTVTLIINDPVTLATCTLTVPINIPVPVTAAANTPATPPYCAGSTITFSDASFTSPTSWLWDFYNNGASTSSLQNSQFIYPAAGSFTWKLTVGDAYGCTGSVTGNITVNPAGTGSIAIDSSFCDSIKLTASGIGPFTWSNVPAQPIPDNPLYITQSGYYSVQGYNSGFGCPYSASVGPLNIRRSPDATITGTTQYCQGENLDIKTGAAGVTIAWNLYPSGPVLGTNPNLSIPLNLAGTFTYQVTVTAPNGCTATDTFTVFVDPVPSSAVIVSSGPLSFCQGDSIMLSVNPPGMNYLWSKSPPPALSSPVNTDSVLWASQSGTYSVIVQTVSGCAYPAIAPVTVTVNPVPPALITGDTVVCENDNLVLQSVPDGGSTYQWNGPFSTGNTNPFVKPFMQLYESGVYTVVVTNSFGCTAKDSVNVTVNPSPPPPFIVSNPGGVLCEGVLYNLSVSSPAGPPVVYNWSTGQIGTSINAAMPGDYSVTATNQYGCSLSSNVLTIHPKPDLSCAPSGCYDFCNDCDSVVIPGPSNVFSYNWLVLSGNTFVPYSNSQNLVVMPPGGIFMLAGANQWGCTDSTDTLKIEFHDCCPPPPIACVDTCFDFNSGTLDGFGPHPSGPNIGISITNNNSQGGPNDYYILANDLPGPSFLLGSDLLDGEWCCGEICYDYLVVDDGVAGSVNVNPEFAVRSGSLGFRFVSSTIVTETSGWQTICAPISNCDTAPVTPNGSWIPMNGTNAGDWPLVIANVSELSFIVDVTPAPSELTGYDNICIHPGMPEIDAGDDTTICAGSVLTLTVSGCSGIPEWFSISGDSLVAVGQGEIVDVTPQQSTCYVAICCNVPDCCCDSDTVCVTVLPAPVLKWPSLPDVCLNSAPVYLDSTNISVWINNTWVPLSLAGGTGFFSGVNVSGNYFNPITPGPNVITYYYTDTSGCTGTISATINVIDCGGCDTTCQISAGPDQVICAGQPAILSVQGCNTTPVWYQIVEGELDSIGFGEMDIFPQQSGCYVVICCNPTPCCCDTDTVCITVKPLPVLQWQAHFGTVCLNSAPVYLDSTNISVWINNTWMPLSMAGGTGFFSGVNVSGSYFNPLILGPNVITYYYTDTSGCTGTISATINVIDCGGCDTTCQISAGPDQVICFGQPAILSVQGCNSTPVWYQIVEGELDSIGFGEMDIFPQQSGCYVVICCNPTPCCCDTDTVCITVKPLPVLQWQAHFGTVCLNSAPVYLDSTNISVWINNTWVPLSLAGGTGFFSGVNVSGNYFNPLTLGPNVITYYYTDTSGCTGTISATINVIDCGGCDTTCQVSAGPDQVICFGQPAILSVQGCNSTPVWYQIVEGELDSIGFGEMDIFPQQSGCYVVICCNPTPCCCDTDTVCITMVPRPVLLWQSFADVCVDSPPVYLDTLNIFVWVNNNWVPAYTMGTGFFSGTNVFGNSFNPVTTGLFTITYTYTDTNGCVGSVSTTINVIDCGGCNPGCQIDAGPDQIICAGQPAILSVQGCNTTAEWFALNPGGQMIPVGAGPVLDVFPNKNTCYVVVCCNPDPCCCDTDTVCITVVKPMKMKWEGKSPVLCLNSAPYFLNAANIYVNAGFGWVPVTMLGGSGFFSGPFVSGNFFTPSAVGNYTINYTYTDPNGCQSVIQITIRVIKCGKVILHAEVLLQGFHSGGGMMDNDGEGGDLFVSQVQGTFYADVDSLTISAHDADSLYLVDSQTGILDITGSVTVAFNDSVERNTEYYIRLNHRNSLETWSATPLLLDSVTVYDFTDNPAKFMGQNAAPLGNGLFGIFSGDIDQDGGIDLTDLLLLEDDAALFRNGYVNPDITGDGMVESADYSLLENNLGRISVHP